MIRFLIVSSSLIIGIALNSCSSNEKNADIGSEKIIHVDLSKAKEYPLSAIYSDVKYLELETDTANLIGLIEKVIKRKNTFYLSSSKSLFIYSDQGKLLSIIKKVGEAEGEFRSITDFAVDSASGTIEIMDRKSQKIITYSPTGDFIKEWKFGINANAFKKINADIYAFHCSTFQSDKKLLYTLILKSKKTNELLFKSFPTDPRKADFLNFTDYNNFNYLGNKTSFTTSGNDTIYDFNVDSVQAKYILNFGKNTMPTSFLDQKYADVVAFIIAWSKTSYAGIFNAFVYEDNDILMTLPTTRANPTGQLDKALMVFNKKSGETKLISSFRDDLFFTNQKELISFTNRPVGFSPHETYSVIEAAEIVDKISLMKKSFSPTEWERLLQSNLQLKRFSATLTLRSNPILRISTFKDTI